MKGITISEAQARAFAATISITEIKAYVNANRSDYERYLKEEAQKQQLNIVSPKRRASRKGAR